MMMFEGDGRSRSNTNIASVETLSSLEVSYHSLDQNRSEGKKKNNKKTTKETLRLDKHSCEKRRDPYDMLDVLILEPEHQSTQGP